MTSKTVPPENNLNKIQGRFTPASILWVTILGIVLAEVIAMIIVYFFQFMPYYQQVLIDAGLMTVIIFPILYYLSFRPILLHIKMRHQAEQDLRNANDELEQHVQDRTEELRAANSELEEEIKVRLQAEEALQESEQRLKRAQEIAHLGSWELDLAKNQLTWSDEVYRIFGLKPQEFGATYQAFLEAVHPVDRTTVNEAYFGSIRDGRDTYEIEHRVVRRSDGETRIVHEKCEHFRNEFGEIIRSIGMVHDITDRKQAEEKLRYQATLLANVNDAIIASDAQYRLSAWNSAAEALYGWKAEEVLGQNGVGIIRTEWLEKDAEAMRRSIAETGSWRGEATQVRGDGTRFPVEISSIVLHDTEGRIAGYVSVNRDITERKKAEEVLQRFQLLSEHSRDIILFMRFEDGHILDANTAAVQAYGYTRDELLALTISDLRGADTRGLTAEQMAQANAGGILFETVHRRKDGSSFPADVSSQGATIGGVRTLVSIVRDITERKKVEDALHLSEENFAKAFKLSPTALVITHLDDGHYVELNDAFCSLVGYDQAELRGRKTTDFNIFVHPDDRKTIVDRLTAAGSIHDYESRIRHRSGAIRDVVASQELITFNGETCILTTLQDITELKQAEEILRKLNRTLRALSNTKQAMLRSTSEKQYLEDVCRIVVEDCGHSMVWIGYAQDDDERSVVPVAFAGFEDGYLETLNISWADCERGHGPTGTAIRTRRPSRCDNMLTDPNFAPWREQALKHGYSSSLVLPLIFEDKAFGAITIYSPEPDIFSKEEETLLTELAGDLAYGIQAIRLREAHAQAEAQLRIAHDELELRVQERTEALAAANLELSSEISERREIERQLRIQTTAMEAAADGILITDPNGFILWSNPALTTLTGYTPGELVRQPTSLFKSDQQDKEYYRQMWTTIVAGEMWQGEIVNRRKDGSLYIEQQTIAPVIGEAGKISHFIAIKHDITDQKQAAEAQRKSDEKFRILADWTYDWELWIDPDAKIVYTSPSSERITGYRPEELMADPDLLLAIVHSDDRAAFADHYYRVHDKDIGAKSLQFRAIRRDGQVCWIEHVCRPLFDAENRYLGRRISNRDITERKKIEAEILERNQREKQLIQMLHTMQLDIARDLHDTIGQNIGYLRMKLDYLDEKSPPYREHDLKAELGKMSQVADESYDLVRGTLAILQAKGPSDLIQLFKKYADQIVERSELKVEFNNTGDAGELSAHQMRQLFYIFREALSNIEKHSGASQARVDVRWEIDTLTLSIQDNGSGFDPLTTPTYGGHYGLKFMRERTEMMNGSLQITAEPGAGTHLLISVPVQSSQMVA